MKKAAGLSAILGILLFICICIPGISNTQTFKTKDINKKGVSKSTGAKPKISDSIRAKLPALEVSRLTLDSGCKITGYIQNKGAKMDASHPDFPKLQIKIGYTFNGKTVLGLLETRPGATAAQPKLLMSYPDMNNFANGRPAKFVSKLQVPATGKGYAIVFAEADPNNLIRETPAGERKKRIQKRLKSGCAPKIQGPVKPKLKARPSVKKSIGSTAPVKKPADKTIPVPKKDMNKKMVTKSIGPGGITIGGSGKDGGEFSILSPLPGTRVNRNNPPAIAWRVPGAFLNRDGSLKVIFAVQLREWRESTGSADGEVRELETTTLGESTAYSGQIRMPYTYNSRSKICRITSWNISSDMEDGDYSIVVLAFSGTPATSHIVPGGETDTGTETESTFAVAGVAYMQRPFEIYTPGSGGSEPAPEDTEPDPDEVLEPFSGSVTLENMTETVEGMLNPAVTIISPNGNEELGLNSGHEIVWKTFARDQERNFRVTLEKHSEGGVNDGRIISEDRSINYDRSTGTYRMIWFVDSDIDPSDFYKIKVSETGGTLEDESNDFFSIRAERAGDQRFLVNVIYPAGSSTSSGGTGYRKIRVKWKGNYNVCRQRSLNIVLHSVAGGREYALPFDSNRAHVTEGDLEFDLPGEISQGDQCYVRVATVPPGCFGSSERFTVRGSIEERNYLHIINPRASTWHHLGDRVKIEWEDGKSRERTFTDPVTSNREIKLFSADTNLAVQTIPVPSIQLSEEGSSFYTFWNIPVSLPNHTSYKIRIRALDTGEETFSYPFYIYQEGIDLTAPGEGMTYYTGLMIPIQWTPAAGSEGDLKIVLVPHNASSINDSSGIEIASDMDAGTGPQFHNWRIPLNTRPGQYKIFVGYDFNRFDGIDTVYESGVFTISKPSLKFTAPDFDSASGTPRLLADNNLTIRWAYEGTGTALGSKIILSLVFTDLSEKRIATFPAANGRYTWQIGRTIENMYDIATPGGGRTPDPHTGDFFQLHIYLDGDRTVADKTRHFIIVPEGE